MKNQSKAAAGFAAKWKGKGYEKGESQSFWLSLLHDVLGVESPADMVRFEEKVKLDNTSFIDVMIPSTHVMIEQKSLGKDLSKSIKQSDGSLLTPFQQAKRYSSELPYSERPRWIVTCNFAEFHVYDMEKPGGEPEVILLKSLGKEYWRLEFLVDKEKTSVSREFDLSMKAGTIVGELYDALLSQYHDPSSPASLRSLNVLCVRLVFCLYAEDALVFGKKNLFHDYLESVQTAGMRRALQELFKVLDTKPEDRDPYLADDNPLLATFPYVNGGLFSDDGIEIPPFNEQLRTLLLDKASIGLDWSGISPTIFGAVFESTLNPETRKKGGMHYTSVENIHKVIDPLFLNSLEKEFREICSVPVLLAKEKRLKAFQEKIALLRFLDPACGSGNFLTETYLSLRRLENRLLTELYGGQTFLGGEGFSPVRVSISQFSGIEINDFAVTVAKAALWIAESQMMLATQDIVQADMDFLPLKTSARIAEGNALRMDWLSFDSARDVLSAPGHSLFDEQAHYGKGYDYIIGNPPFLGYSLQSREQKEDILSVYVDERGKPYKTAGKIDYVAGWYFKAAKLMQGTNTRTAFVSTNSITQGEQVAYVWKVLFNRFGIHIDFAYRTFRWNSESSQKAHVHCVIAGFSCAPNEKPKVIYDGDNAIEAANINAYLVDTPNVFVENRSKPISDVPEMATGNRPADNGHLIIEENDYEDFIKKEPRAKQYIKRLIGSEEFINNKKRYCLWLVGVAPNVLRSMPLVMERIKRCRESRLESRNAGRRKLANTPAFFRETLNPEASIVVPVVSSERRQYVPIGFIKSNIICNDRLKLIPSATLYHFGVLTSSVHMAWMRAVAGRLKSDYNYSKDIVYNNFVWPEVIHPATRTAASVSSAAGIAFPTVTEAQMKEVERTAQGILDARAQWPDSSLADLYDERTMPSGLRKAHQENDRAVLALYGLAPDTPEPDIVSRLMSLYLAKTSPSQR